MTTWVDASDAATTWSTDALEHGYVFVDYVLDDYVLGYELSGPWTEVSDVSTTWTTA